MKLERTLDIIIIAYVCTALDVIATTYGLVKEIGVEGNVFVKMVTTSPYHQIIYITTSSIIASWILYASMVWIADHQFWKTREHILSAILMGISVIGIGACFSHLFGVATWLIL